MKAQIIRCQNDLDLFNRLKENQDVKRVNEFIAKQEKEKPMGLRRRLLASSVRLSRTMAPDLHTLADSCIATLEVETELELYVFQSPQFNAMCFKPEDGRLFVMFSSSLLEAFGQEELQFVLGHELGHHIYDHHAIPIGYLLRGAQKPDHRLVLELFAWSRYAEISADRAGAHCVHNLESVARSLFKLASGLKGSTITFELEEFLQQIDDMVTEDRVPGVTAPKEDWFSTHPFSPLRVKALKLFDESEYEREGGMGKSDLEMSVQGLMSLMEPSYIEGKTEAATHMRRLLSAGAIAVANASDGISEEEIKIFEQFFGQGEFSTSLDLERLIKDLPNRTQKAKEHANELQRMQVLRDLCLVARASGDVTGVEQRVLEEIAVEVGVPARFIQQAIDQQVEPD